MSNSFFDSINDANRPLDPISASLQDIMMKSLENVMREEYDNARARIFDTASMLRETHDAMRVAGYTAFDDYVTTVTVFFNRIPGIESMSNDAQNQISNLVSLLVVAIAAINDPSTLTAK